MHHERWVFMVLRMCSFLNPGRSQSWSWLMKRYSVSVALKKCWQSMNHGDECEAEGEVQPGHLLSNLLAFLSGDVALKATKTELRAWGLLPILYDWVRGFPVHTCDLSHSGTLHLTHSKSKAVKVTLISFPSSKRYIDKVLSLKCPVWAFVVLSSP